MATPKNHSVQKAFRLLEGFRDCDEWLTSCELSRRAGLPEASGYRLIQTLEEIGAVVRGLRGRYRPGMLLLSLSHNVVVGELLREAGHAIISEMAQRLDVTAHLGLLEGSMVTCIAKAATPVSIPTPGRPGSQLKAYCSSLGKVLLAALPAAELDGFIMQSELMALTPYTVTDPVRLRAQLDKVRRQGFAMGDREIRIDMRCIAVPVHDAEGRIIAAMSAADYAGRMETTRQKQMRAALLEAAGALEHKLSPASVPRAAAPARRMTLRKETMVAAAS